jgi:hypothetical protein
MAGEMKLQAAKRPPMRVLALVLALAALSANAREKETTPVLVSPEATAAAPEQKLANRGRTFVPLHSTLIGQGGVARLNFSGTLSIHNASATNVLSVDRIDYRGGAGEIVETYVSEPVYLKPYGSMRIAIAQDDVRAGLGASFTIDWSTPPGSDDPAIEALMVSVVGAHSYSFLSPGRRVSRPQ